MFRTSDFALRPLRREDLRMVLDWRNSVHIRDASINDEIITWEQHSLWFERLQDNKPARNLVFCCFGQPVGVVNFNSLDAKNGTAGWGFYLGRQDLPKKSGTALGYYGIDYGFKVLGLRKLIGEVIESNVRSTNFHLRLGFEREGHLRKQLSRLGEWKDLLVFGLLVWDWNSMHRERVGATLFSDWSPK